MAFDLVARLRLNDEFSGRMRNVGRQMDSVKSKMSQAAKATTGIATAIGGVAIASKAFNVLSGAVDGAIARYDTMNQFPKVMEKIGFSTDDSTKSIKRLAEGIDGLPTTLNEVAETTQRIAVMTKDLDGATETTLALNNAFLASGSDAEKASRGTEQYLKTLATGKMSMDSWTTLQETMGLALGDVAEAFGFAGTSAQNDLYKALKDGNVTFDQFNDKLIELSEATGGFAEAAKDGTGGLATAWKNVNNAVTVGVAGTLMAIDRAMGGTGEIEDKIKKIKPVIGDVFKVVNKYVLKAVKLFKKLSDFIKPVMPALKQVGKFLLIVGAALGGMAAGVAIIGGLSTVLGLLLTPVSLIIVGIAVLAAGLVTAYKKMEPFRKKIEGVVKGLKGFRELLKGNEGTGISLLMSMGISPETYFKIKTFADNIVKAGKKLKDAKSMFSGFFDTFKNGGTADGLKKMLEDGLDMKQIGKVYEFTNRARAAYENLEIVFDAAAKGIEFTAGKIADALALIQSTFEITMGDEQGGVDLAKRIGISDEQIQNLVNLRGEIETAIGGINAAFKLISGDEQTGMGLAQKLGMSEEQIAKITAFADGVKGVFASIKDTFGQLKDKFFEVVEQISPKFESLAESFGVVKDVVVSIFTSLWTILQPIFSALSLAFTVIGDLAIIAFNNIIVPAVKWIATAFQTMWAIVGPILEFFAAAIELAMVMLKKMWDLVLKPFVEYLSKHFGAIIESSGEYLKKLGDEFSGVGDFISKGTDLIKTFADALKNVKIPDWVTSIGGKLKGAAQAVGNFAFGTGPGIQDPGSGEGRYNGIKYVPRDNGNYRLHRGERVLTAKENKQYGKGGNGISVVVTGNDFHVRQESDIDDIANKIVRKFIAAGEGGA